MLLFMPWRQPDWRRIINNKTEVNKKTTKYINVRDYENSAVYMVAYTGSPVMKTK